MLNDLPEDIISIALFTHGVCVAGIFRKPLWAALEHLYSRLVLPQESSPPTPGSGVDLEGPALSLHNEMALIQKCAMLQLRLGMLLMELEAYQLSQQTADPRRDNSTEKERAQSMRPQAHCGWNQACAFNKAPCLLSFCWCVSYQCGWSLLRLQCASGLLYAAPHITPVAPPAYPGKRIWIHVHVLAVLRTHCDVEQEGKMVMMASCGETFGQK